MSSLYVSHGSEYADIEAISSYCLFNDPSSLTVLLFKDSSRLKSYLTKCYKGITVIVSKHTSTNSVGIYESARCPRAYAVSSAKKFACELFHIMSCMYSSSIRNRSKPAIFVFNETVKVTGGVGEIISLSSSNTVMYTANTESVHSEHRETRSPSILSGCIIWVDLLDGCDLSNLVSTVSDTLSDLTSCSCLGDVIVYKVLKEFKMRCTKSVYSLPEAMSSIRVNYPHGVEFTNISSICSFSKIITSPYRFIPAKVKNPGRYLSPDSKCKVGLISGCIDHAALLNATVVTLRNIAKNEKDFAKDVKFKVYLIGANKKDHHSIHHKGNDLTVSNLKRIASKCKYVCFFPDGIFPSLEFFSTQSWMAADLHLQSNGESVSSAAIKHSIQVGKCIVDATVKNDETSPVNNPLCPHTVANALGWVECFEKDCPRMAMHAVMNDQFGGNEAYPMPSAPPYNPHFISEDPHSISGGDLKENRVRDNLITVASSDPTPIEQLEAKMAQLNMESIPMCSIDYHPEEYGIRRESQQNGYPGGNISCLRHNRFTCKGGDAGERLPPCGKLDKDGDPVVANPVPDVKTYGISHKFSEDIQVTSSKKRSIQFPCTTGSRDSYISSAPYLGVDVANVGLQRKANDCKSPLIGHISSDSSLYEESNPGTPIEVALYKLQSVRHSLDSEQRVCFNVTGIVLMELIELMDNTILMKHLGMADMASSLSIPCEDPQIMSTLAYAYMAVCNRRDILSSVTLNVMRYPCLDDDKRHANVVNCVLDRECIVVDMLEILNSVGYGAMVEYMKELMSARETIV